MAELADALDLGSSGRPWGFKSLIAHHLKLKSGNYSMEATPVPISNTEVKLLSADDTWWEAAWESRTLPVFYLAQQMLSFFIPAAPLCFIRNYLDCNVPCIFYGFMV